MIGVVLEMWTGIEWRRTGDPVSEASPPGSLHSDWPTRQVYLFGWLDGFGGPAVWRSQLGLDSEIGPARLISTTGFHQLADLTEGPYEMPVVLRSRHMRARFRLEGQ